MSKEVEGEVMVGAPVLSVTTGRMSHAAEDENRG